MSHAVVQEATITAPSEPSDADRRKRARSQRARHSAVVTASQILVLVAFLALWELSSGRWIDGFFISRPSLIFEIWWKWVLSGELWYHAQSTLATAGLGFVVGCVAALMVGYILGGAERLAEVFEPFITAIYSLPKIALIPLLVMWVGVGTPLQVTISALVTFFLMFYNTFFGIQDVNRALVDSVRIMGASGLTIALRVRIPSALVWVVAGLKIAVPQALIATVVGEMLASNRGLGHLVASNAAQFNTAGTFAALFSLLIVGLLVDRFVRVITRRAMVWRKL